MSIITWPEHDVIKQYAMGVPMYMRPSMTPFAVIAEAWLSNSECDRIIECGEFEKPYEFHGCDAITRDLPDMLGPLSPIDGLARVINGGYFNYDLDSESHSYMQTYEPDGFYRKHYDAAPGTSRKLTAVVLLSPPEQYLGGALKFYHEPLSFTCPDTRGTIVVFPSWLLHEVEKVYEGKRQTINMGFWGPPFR